MDYSFRILTCHAVTCDRVESKSSHWILRAKRSWTTRETDKLFTPDSPNAICWMFEDVVIEERLHNCTWLWPAADSHQRAYWNKDNQPTDWPKLTFVHVISLMKFKLQLIPVSLTPHWILHIGWRRHRFHWNIRLWNLTLSLRTIFPSDVHGRVKTKLPIS